MRKHHCRSAREYANGAFASVAGVQPSGPLVKDAKNYEAVYKCRDGIPESTCVGSRVTPMLSDGDKTPARLRTIGYEREGVYEHIGMGYRFCDFIVTAMHVVDSARDFVVSGGDIVIGRAVRCFDDVRRANVKQLVSDGCLDARIFESYGELGEGSILGQVNNSHCESTASDIAFINLAAQDDDLARKAFPKLELQEAKMQAVGAGEDT